MAAAPVVLVVLWSWFAAAWSATRVGDAQVVAPADATTEAGQPLASGNAATAFSLALPLGASCRGDSANDGYKVQTYMVPEGVDPATLTFGSVGPVPTGTGKAFRQPLFDTTTSPVVNHQTAAATRPPGPGPIVNIPSVNFMVYKAGDIPAGTYNLGIACTRGPVSPTQLDTFWNTKIVVAAGSGPGAAITWTAPSSAAQNSARSDTAPSDGPAPQEAATGASQNAPKPAAAGPAGSATDGSPEIRFEAQPSGAPPTLGLPGLGTMRLPVIGGSRLVLALRIGLVLVAMRIASLLLRPAPVAGAR